MLLLTPVGISIKPVVKDVPTYNTLRESSNFSLIYAGQGNGPDPDTISSLYVSTASIAKSFGTNIPELDKLFQQGVQEIDTTKRATIYQNICKIQNDQLPNAPMWVTTRFGAVSNKVGNFIWSPSPGGGRYYEAAETWTVSK